MSSEPHIFFSDVNERQGSFLRRTFLLPRLVKRKRALRRPAGRTVPHD